MVERLYSKDNLGVYYSAKEKVATAIETAFGLEDDVLSLASPTFFSQAIAYQRKNAQAVEYLSSSKLQSNKKAIT